MGESVGILSFPSNEGEEYQVKPYSKQLQQKMDMVRWAFENYWVN